MGCRAWKEQLQGKPKVPFGEFRFQMPIKHASRDVLGLEISF